MKSSRLVALAIGVAVAPLMARAQMVAAPVPMMAEPSISPDGATVAFVSGGDIWEVPANGGVAHLIVSDAATEGRPLYSPDGKSLAFTSTRGGSPNIYVLDLAGGAVRRITYAEATEELDSWSPDGRWLYFSSSINDIGRQPDVFRISATGGTAQEVSAERYLAEFQASPSPDGQRIALVARGLSGTQWWRNGHSHIDESEIWLRSLDGKGGYALAVPGGAKNAWPIWDAGGASITFMSDRDGVENLWSLPLMAGAQPRKLTTFTDGRLLFPAQSRPGGPIVFERDMRIWRYDPATGQAAPIDIALRGAPASEGRRHITERGFDSLAASPDGKKVALITRGEMFASPVKDPGRAQRIDTGGVANREVRWAPDSRHLVYVTESGDDRRIGEYDFNTDSKVWLTGAGAASVPVYSPDGTAIVYVKGDRELRLLRRPKGGGVQDVLLFSGAVATDEDGSKPAWSPDGRMIAFAVRDARSFVNVYVVPAAGGEARPISFLANGELSQIAWAPDGRYILFGSAQRTESSKIIRVDLVPQVPKYREDVFRDLFKPASPGRVEDKSDTTNATANPRPEDQKPASDAPSMPDSPAPKPSQAMVIEWRGLRERATVLPLNMDARDPLITSDGQTLVFRAEEGNRSNLYRYSLDELAPDRSGAKQISSSEYAKGDFATSGDGKTLFWLDNRFVTSSALGDPRPSTLAISADIDVDFDKMRRVVFDEAWLTLNEQFFDPGFHGRDWSALRRRFEPFALAARNPDELRRVINLMIGELNASHSGINRPGRGDGAFRSDRVGDLGLRFDRAAYESGRGLIIREIVPLGPVDLAGKVVVGDRLVAVDGMRIDDHANLDALLENKVGIRVVLTIGSGGGERQVSVRPVGASTAAGLLYRSWVASRRALVERLSNGTLGYVHLFDMSADSLNQLYLDLDAQNQAGRGVVIDIRNNNGGFVNGNALDVFTRRNYLLMTPRDLFTLPARQNLGQRALGLPTILLTNESSLSDSEDFTEGYRRLGAGKVVGQPTAGWIIFTGARTLVDGSVLRVPFIRIQDVDGGDMEMHARPVDITVSRTLGQPGDAQIEAAVKELMSEVGAAPKKN